MKNKIFVLGIVLSLLFSVMLVAVGGEATEIEQDIRERTDDTISGVTGINDWHELYEVRNDLSGDYELMNDLGPDTDGYEQYNDPETEGWEPIGQYDEQWNEDPFTGTFDGQGYVIDGLYINRTEVDGVGYIGGLFGHVDGATIENLGVTDVDITNIHPDWGAAGGIVAYLESSDSLISNCYVTGDVNGTFDVGALVGCNWEATILGSYATGNVSGGWGVGGLVGTNYEGTVENSYANSNVSGEGGIGGLIGYNWEGTVENSHYNIDEVLINGGRHVTFGGLFDEQYQDWIEDKELDIADYSETLEPSNDCYEISSVDGLRDLLGFAGYEGYSFRLIEDIDLSEEPGLYIPYLAADFDGNGHLISNLHIDIPFSSFVGMFGRINENKVANVGLVEADVTGDWDVGALVGLNYEGAVVENSYATGSVSGVNRVGGLVGYNYVQDHMNKESKVFNSYATVNVSGEDYVGGLVGYHRDSRISNSYATGNVSGDSNVGGLVGFMEYSTVSKSYWNIETSGQDESDGGEGRTTEEMTWEYAENTYEDWDFDETWMDGDHQIVEDREGNRGYPALSWQLKEYNLTIEIEGEGTTDPIEGNHTYAEGTVVTVEATPAEGWYFDRWTGDHEGEAEQINITMDSDKSITAVFNESVKYNLTIEIEGEGTTDPVEGNHTYAEGTVVTVEATPAEGWYFDRWTGDHEGEAEQINITMDSDKSITAVFEEFEQAYFEVEIIDYQEEIQVGRYLKVEFTIENTGDFEDTQNITFTVGGSVEDMKEVTLEGGENETYKFFWEAEMGSHILTVASEDDEDAVAVHVHPEEGLMPGFTSVLLILATIFAVIICRKKKR